VIHGLPCCLATSVLLTSNSRRPETCGLLTLHLQVQGAPFFSMPVANGSSDPYISNMAKVVADKLDPGLKVYIEFGQAGPGWITTALVRSMRGQGVAIGIAVGGQHMVVKKVVRDEVTIRYGACASRLYTSCHVVPCAPQQHVAACVALT